MTKTILGSLLLVCALLVSGKGFAQTQKEIDEKILAEYFAKEHITPMRTPSGLFYAITKKGTGENAKAGKVVHMNYIGKFMDGRIFDQNVDEAYKPVNGRTQLDFTIGVGQVIKGWDEGIQLLNPGSRATLFIPSGLGYGSTDHGPIPANSIMVFNVELLGVDK